MKSVKIGNQEWMQENLVINDGGEGITCNPDNGQYYYTWGAAMRIAKSIPGWHLPSAEEWNAAAEACGAMAVGNKHDYVGTEKLYDSLKVLLMGGYSSGSFFDVGSYACFWSATEYNSILAYTRNFDTSNPMYQYEGYKADGFSVRLIKD